MCKPIRNAYNQLTTAISSSKRLTAIIVSIPMITMISGLIYAETTFDIVNFNGVSYSLQAYKNIILSPVYAITTLTLIAGTAALFGLYWGLQNLVGSAAIIYAAIAYWAIVNICIVFVPIWYYFSIHTVGSILCAIIFCAFAWLFTSDIMDAHRVSINKAIELSVAS